jgi:hypothetical protein
VLAPGEDERGPASGAETVVTVLFTAAAGALTVLTAGVAYLTITQWLDNQQDKKDLKAFDTSVQACVLSSGLC